MYYFADANIRRGKMVLVLLRVGIFLFTGVWEETAFIRVDPADSCWAECFRDLATNS